MKQDLYALEAVIQIFGEGLLRRPVSFNLRASHREVVQLYAQECIDPMSRAG
jgi:hypothetical protein